MRYRAEMRFVLLLLVLALLSGCKSTGQAGGVQYNAFYGPDDHVEELLAAGNALEASKVYNANAQAFGPKDQPTLDKLAVAVQAVAQPKMTAALAGLRAAVWPAPVEQWPTVKKALDDAREAQDFAEGQAVLGLPGKALPDLNTLRAERAKLESATAKDAREAFAAYPLFSQRHFFRDYPAALNPEQFLSQNQDILWNRLSAATPADIAALFNSYREELDDPCEAQVAEHYFRSILGGDPQKADIARILHAAGETKKAGMPLTRLAGVKVAFVNVTSPTLLKEKQIEFPLHLDIDMPVEVQETPLERAFESEGAKAADVIVVISVAMARTDRDVTLNEKKSSKFMAGTREVINPEYQKLKMQYDQTVANKMGTDIRAAIPSTDVFGNLANSLASLSYTAKLDTLTKKLAETPPVLQEPIYQDYKVSIADVSSEKIATVNYYVIDKRAKTMFADTFDARSTATYSVVYEMEDKDVNKESFSSQYASEEIVVGWENEPVVVQLSSLMAEFGKSAQNTKKITSLEDVKRELIVDRNKAIQEAAARKYTDARNDQRFDSVVVVYNSTGGLGSGFYITEDIVITNSHVVQGTKIPVFKCYDKQEMTGRVIAEDLRLDLAVVKVSKRGVPVAFYSENEINLGAQLDVIGHPSGLEFSISRGIVSALRKMETVMGVKGKPVLFIQTDAATNPGNSGGPVFMGDKVVGVHDRGNKRLQNVNYSIHYSEVLHFLRKNGITPRI